MNSEAHSFDDLISCHFDDAASSTETAALAEHLISDPGAALQFVSTARVHTLMESIARPQAAVRFRILRRWAAFGAAAAVIAVAAGAVLYLAKTPLTSSSRPQIVQDAREHSTGRKPLPPGVNLRTVKNFGAGTTVPPASLEFLLANFYVHSDPNGLRVPEALRALERAIGEANLLSRPELAALKFTAGASLIPPVTTQDGTLPGIQYDRAEAGYKGNPIIYSPLKSPFTIRDYLNICGLYREVTQQPGGVRYAAVPAAIAPEESTPLKARLETRTFRTSPDLLRLQFADEPSDLRQLLMNQFGVSLATREVPGFSADHATLTVNSSEAKLDRIQQILEVCSKRKVWQHYLTTTYLLCVPDLLPPDFDATTGMLLSEVEFQRFKERLSQAKGVELVTAPPIIVRAGQPSAIEILREVPGRQPVEPLESDWFGLRQEVLTTPVGETIQISGLVDFGLPADSGVAPFTSLVGDGSAFLEFGGEDVAHHRTGFDLWVPDRCTAMFTLDVETRDDRVAVACLTAQVIDPAGNPRSRD